MSKKLMLLAAGVLAIVAFSALPGVASAAEFNGTCSGAACTGTVESTSLATLEGATGSSVKCLKTTGTSVQTNASPTGTLQLLFHECTDESLGTSCHSIAGGVSQPAGTITTNSLVTHLAVIHASPKTVGVLLTGINVTFECAGGLVRKTVTGNIIGEIVNPECGVAKATTSFKFAAGTTTGTQKWTQITTTGTVFDLTSNNDSGGAYETASQSGEGKLKWGGNVTLDC